MSDVFWKMPGPVTGLIRGPRFSVLEKGECEIAFSVEAEDGSEKWLKLQFKGMEAFKATYLASLQSIARELRTQAYGALVAVEESPWLTSVRSSYLDYCAARQLTPQKLQLLMICFDDGPCYEIICQDFAVETKDT